MKHPTEHLTLNHLVNLIDRDTDTPWHEVLGVDIAGHQEAVEADDYDKANKIEADYLNRHSEDIYHVEWPEHVTVPRYNSDACYIPYRRPACNVPAIVTRYLGPTDFRGSRIKATVKDKSITVPYDDALSSEENHHVAVVQLCEIMGWDFGYEVVGAVLPDENRVWVWPRTT